MLSLQVEKTEDQIDPRFCIFRNKKYDQLPPTLFIVAEIDALRDESYGRPSTMYHDPRSLVIEFYDSL